MRFPAVWQLFAPVVRVTDTNFKKILRESRSEVLKPHFFIAELCRRNKKKRLNMKVITIESSAYEAMMERIAEIAGFVREVRDARLAEGTERLLDTREAARMLGVCRRTLQRMRTEHRIGYVLMNGKCRYRLSEINRLLDAHTVAGDGGTLDDLHHNYRVRTGSDKPKGRRT